MTTGFQHTGLSNCSRAEQGYNTKTYNQGRIATMNQNDRWLHLLQGTMQTKAIPSPHSQHSETFSWQSHCPLSQMVGPVMHKAIHSCVLAGWSPGSYYWLALISNLLIPYRCQEVHVLWGKAAVPEQPRCDASAHWALHRRCRIEVGAALTFSASSS